MPAGGWGRGREPFRAAGFERDLGPDQVALRRTRGQPVLSSTGELDCTWA